jgi:hypothetical protein
LKGAQEHSPAQPADDARSAAEAEADAAMQRTTTQQGEAQAMKAEDTTMTSDDTTAALSAATAAAAVAAATSAATAATPALAVAATPLLFGLPPMSAPGSLSNDGGAGTSAATPALQAPPPLASAGLQPMPSFLSPFAFGSPAGWQPTPQQYMAWQSHMASASAGTPGSAAALHSAQQQQQLYGPYSSSMQLGSGGNVPMFAMPAGGGGMMSAGGASAGSASGDAINLNDERRPWTKEEDQKVNELVKKHGNKKWYTTALLSTHTQETTISTVPKTTNCSLVDHCSFPFLCSASVLLLLPCPRTFRSLVGSMLEGRTGKQCRERWFVQQSSTLRLRSRASICSPLDSILLRVAVADCCLIVSRSFASIFLCSQAQPLESWHQEGHLVSRRGCKNHRIAPQHRFALE